MKGVLATLVVLAIAIGVAVAVLPRAEVLRTVEDAKLSMDALLDELGTAAERVSDDGARLLREAGERMERVRRDVFSSEDEKPRIVTGRRTVEAYRPTVSGRVRIVDGDTLDIGGVQVRLHGIDAPESRQSCVADGRRWACGERATRALSGRIGGRTVACEERDRDRYGRTVAVCRAAGEDLNVWMVREGWALAYRRYSMAYVAEETAARSARRGIWRGDFVAPWDWRRGERLAGSRTAEKRASGAGCRIKGNVSRDGTRIYHVPGGRFYDRTRIDTSKGERWFCTEAEARAAGWRKSRR